MALETIHNLLAKGVNNAQRLQQALIEQSKQIAKEREQIATKQALEQQLNAGPQPKP